MDDDNEGEEGEESADNDDSYTTYSLEYESSDEKDSDTKLFRSNKIDMNKNMDNDNIGNKNVGNDMAEEELLLQTIRESPPPSDYKDGMKKEKEDNKVEKKEESIERGSDESGASWGLGGLDQSLESDISTDDDGEDSRSSFITLICHEYFLLTSILL